MQYRLVAKIADRQRGEQKFNPFKNLTAEDPDVDAKLREDFRKEVQRSKTNRQRKGVSHVAIRNRENGFFRA